MLCLYVGYSNDMMRRILQDHCGSGTNVEASTLRMSIAEAMGYRIKRTKRATGSYKTRIDLANPREGEDRVSEYIRSGKWKYVICQSLDEARGFKKYAMERLQPRLNKERVVGIRQITQRYEDLLNQLEACPLLSYSHLSRRQSGPGVHVFYHEQMPPQI